MLEIGLSVQTIDFLVVEIVKTDATEDTSVGGDDGLAAVAPDCGERTLEERGGDQNFFLRREGGH